MSLGCKTARMAHDPGHMDLLLLVLGFVMVSGFGDNAL